MKPYALKTPNNLSRSDQRKKHDTGHNTSDSKPVVRKKKMGMFKRNSSGGAFLIKTAKHWLNIVKSLHGP